MPLEIAITRMAATNEAEKAKQAEGGDDERTENRTMGRKYIVPYGLYRAHGFVSAKLAERTGFSRGRSSFVWDSLRNMFEHDRSAARGEMAARKLVVFEHASALGNAQAHDLFERVRVDRVSGEDVYPHRRQAARQPAAGAPLLRLPRDDRPRRPAGRRRPIHRACSERQEPTRGWARWSDDPIPISASSTPSTASGRRR